MLFRSVFGDDGGIPYKDEAAVKSFFADLKTHMGDILEKSHYICLVIEADEVFGAGGVKYVEGYCAELQRLFSGPSIANHMTSGEYGWSMECPSVDVHFHQVNPSASATDCEKELRAVVRKATKPVLACEFSLHGDTQEASDKATRAIAAGCIGVHSGVPKNITAPVVDEWARIKWTSENYAGAVEKFELKATISGDKVNFIFPAYNWPQCKTQPECNAIACFFVWNGSQFEGGKFEWIRTGGQAVKELKNIREGYGGLKVPAAGTRAAFAWVSDKGDLRSNLAETVWK